MSDGASIGPEVSVPLQGFGREPQTSGGEALRAEKGVSLYKSDRFEVFVPEKLNIPVNEGLHVQITSGHDESDSPKQVLARYVMAEGVAKTLAESGLTRDAWANTRIEAGQRVSVYGRVPGEENSWRKPVDTLDRNVGSGGLESFYNTSRLQELSGRYLPKWEKLVGSMELFRNGVGGRDLEIGEQGSSRIWESDTHSVDVIRSPHLKGFHLIVNPKEDFKRQWQTVRESPDDIENSRMVQKYILSTLEATAIAMGVQKLLAEGRGEIHNSGNWAGGLKIKDEGGKLDLENLQENKKAEKRAHRPDNATDTQQFDTSMHVHVYIPESGRVILPQMSRGEAEAKGRGDIVAQWDQIPSATQEQIDHIKSKLGQGKLTAWLETNCKGKL